MPKAQERFRIDSNLGYEKRGMTTRDTRYRYFDDIFLWNLFMLLFFVLFCFFQKRKKFRDRWRATGGGVEIEQQHTIESSTVRDNNESTHESI
jgi:hypothetical protein